MPEPKKAKTLDEAIEQAITEPVIVHTFNASPEGTMQLSRFARAIAKATIEACMPEIKLANKKNFGRHDPIMMTWKKVKFTRASRDVYAECSVWNECRAEMKRLAEQWLGEGGV